MGLLKSVDNVPGIDYYEYRDDDYYGKYTYRAKVTMLGMKHVSYSKDVADLTERITKGKYSYGYSKPDRVLIKYNLPVLTKLMEWKIQSKKDKISTIRGEHNTIAVFSNDLNYLHTLKAIDPFLVVKFTQVQKSNFTGVKHFVREPKHKYRVYMKSRRIESGFIQEWKELLDRIDGLHPSPGLRYWLDNYDMTQPSWSWRYRWSSASFFIDYDDESTLSYLALMHGEILGKRYKLEKRPEEV
jgi:hypothetical protein